MLIAGPASLALATDAGAFAALAGEDARGGGGDRITGSGRHRLPCQAPGTVRILRLSRPALMPRRGDIAQTYRGPAGLGRMGDADGSAGPAGTRSSAGIHDGFCSPAAVSRYPGTMVAGSARTRSSRAAPAISGVSGSPSCFRYSSSVWPPRAAYARIPRLPTSPNEVIRGITAVTVIPSPARRDSSWAYAAM